MLSDNQVNTYQIIQLQFLVKKLFLYKIETIYSQKYLITIITVKIIELF